MSALRRLVRRYAFPIGGAVALLVVLGAGAPAEAACGDYVIVVRPGDPPPHDPAPHPAPGCRGPACSAPPAHAGPVAPPRLVERPSLDLAAASTVPDGLPSARAARGPDDQVRPIPLTADIFHPPRAR